MIHWSSGWRPLDDSKLHRYFDRELAWELEENPRHILASRSFKVIGGLGGYDDFIVRLDDTDDYAWVHLAWNRENQPAWPHCELIGGIETLDHFLAAWASSVAADD